ncbi:magnesium transporter [Corynebacterium sp. MC-17D]|uniref:general stress protein n=1 Tax=Corynebacterium lipophilum TaxID=2804918 RepID=UPI00209460A0|nr:general stress protein [Corynebacterium lipophilum]MCZ2116415.1 magnesium transporter [Corynebacterium lipophilum]
MAQLSNNRLVAREVPTGWPVGSFNTYQEAQEAVDTLSDKEFPVEKLTIVGVDLMQVESITGRLTWGKVLGGGALSGLWMGMFIGIIFSLFAEEGGWGIFASCVAMGGVFGAIFAAIAYAFTGGKRDFASATSIVARRYDVLCAPDAARRARDMIAAMRPQRDTGRPTEPSSTDSDASEDNAAR